MEIVLFGVASCYTENAIAMRCLSLACIWIVDYICVWNLYMAYAYGAYNARMLFGFGYVDGSVHSRRMFVADDDDDGDDDGDGDVGVMVMVIDAIVRHEVEL